MPLGLMLEAKKAWQPHSLVSEVSMVLRAPERLNLTL
jgi:hypothetical protein